MSDTEPFEGGCLCGAIRYRIRAAPHSASTCHCRMCQRQSGAPFIGFFSIRGDELEILAGEIRRYGSSPMAQRGFCAICGSTLSFEYDFEPERIGIAICSLDQPERVAPQMHWGVESWVPWLVIADGLPRRRTDEDEEFLAARARAERGG